MTTTPDDLPIRIATDADYEPVTRMVWRAFGGSYDVEEEFRGIFEPARALIVDDDGQIVAHAAAYTRDLTVPGAAMPAAHVTLVAVHPTYRRRGLLTRLMHRQLRDVRTAGTEPVAVLWASEGRIYQRYGYGAVAQRTVLDADRRQARFLPRFADAGTAGRLREAVPGDVRADLAALYERVRPGRVGWSSRSAGYWTYHLRDKPGGDTTALTALLYETADGPAGYALWRGRPGWEHGPAGTVSVHELVAATPDAYAALWRFLLNVDLTRTVEYQFAAPDEPLPHLLDEPRVLRPRLADSLWLRLVDLPAALTGRRYSAPLDTVFDVTDDLFAGNAGRWRLRVDATGTATCGPTTDAADLACDVADLGAAYLGGVSLTTLAAAARVRELRPGALLPAAASWHWPHAPSPIDTF